MGNNIKPVLSSQLKEIAQKDLLWFIHMIYVFSLFWYVHIYGLFFWFIHWKVLIGGSQGANITQPGALPTYLGDLILFPGMALLGLGAVLVHTWDQCLQMCTFPLLSRPQASSSYNVINTTLQCSLSVLEAGLWLMDILLSMAESESCSYAGCLTANKQLDKLSSLSFKTSHSGLTMESHKVNP